MPSFSLSKGSSLLAFVVSAFLVACSEGDPGAGGAGGAGGEETGGGGAGGEASCDDVLDDEALEEPMSIVVTNERSTPVYLTPGGCAPVGWSVDGKSMFEAAIPTCEGLHEGEPGGPACGPSAVRRPAAAAPAARRAATTCSMTRRSRSRCRSS
ncbi:hypothetical protein [Sorangium cellulosum]|uniref:Uncharacterized protein n=1 Tax=Sorangium cellulosum So0157-2 TaxID=1254432 RepID=S4Y0S0_SORCE|nr:hypothetical protein [Sorangium cellulosum]AGP38354.1 hypothetical protein SCE1572_30045 [Sorangium cellulosum So0157-2]